MAIGAGLAAQCGIATEVTNGTAATVTRFQEINNESMAMVKNPVQGQGLRAPSAVGGAGLFQRTSPPGGGSGGAGGAGEPGVPVSSPGPLPHDIIGGLGATPTPHGAAA